MQTKVRGFGFRGWMLFIYQFLAYLSMVVFTNWPMNVLGSTISGLMGKQENFIANVYTVGMLLGVVIQIFLSSNVGKIKSIRVFAAILGVISMVLAALVTFINPFQSPVIWTVFYFLTSLFISIWCTFSIGILIGQWFPRRKGTFMGLVTIAFPAGNALISTFIVAVFTAPNGPSMTRGLLPYFIACVIGLIIGIILVPDFPEQCGAYRDNDRSMDPEMAKKMTEFEIENRKTTVWTLGKTLSSSAFWLLTIPMGFLLIGSIGIMTQSTTIIGTYFPLGSTSFTLVTLGIAVIACIGSYVLGLVDTKFGTKLAMLIAVGFMIVSGVIGLIKTPTALVISLLCLGVFMGAASNFTVSGVIQYWRIEDFPSVFARVNPVANLMQSFSAMIFATLLFTLGYTYDFLFILVTGVISMVLLLIFRPSLVKNKDDKLRAAAGKPLDDALVGRK
ncbi:MAG: MFS transporter [Lachnospiraceae bacterium]|nr:MFS transporter [Lachnospiraceae bacterium]